MGRILPVPSSSGLPFSLLRDFSVRRAVYESGVRPFSPLERLLTQGRVSYFLHDFASVPDPFETDVSPRHRISRTLLRSVDDPGRDRGGSLFCLAAFCFAGKKPLLSFASSSSFLNHLVEGTVIPLELIFEHRNYIPSMFFFVPIAVLMVRCLDYFSYRSGFQYFMAGGFALLLAFQGHTTFARNDIVRSDVHLWLDNVRKSPEPQPSAHQPGKALLRGGDV